VFRYAAFGFRFSSEIALAIPDESRELPEVTVQYGDLPPLERTDYRLGRIALEYHTAHPDNGVTVDVPWAARYHVVDGRTITVAPYPGVSEVTVAEYFTALVILALFDQNDILALHGSAVATAAGAIIICGNRGAGKSTTAAALAQAGHPVLCDDIVPITAARQVMPGIGVPRLCPDAYRRLDGPVNPKDAVYDGVDKYLLSKVPRSFRPTDPAMAVVLQPGQTESVSVTRLTGYKKAQALLTHTTGLPAPKNGVVRLDKVSRRLSNVPVFDIRRPYRRDTLQGLCFEIAHLVESNSTSNYSNLDSKFVT